MPRPGDPKLIYLAQRAGILNRLRDEARMDEIDSEYWITRWEREAEATGRKRGSRGYWDDAWRWIEERRHPQKVVKTDMGAEGDDGQVFGG